MERGWYTITAKCEKFLKLKRERERERERAIYNMNEI
jgi:hypothetical protein